KQAFDLIVMGDRLASHTRGSDNSKYGFIEIHSDSDSLDEYPRVAGTVAAAQRARPIEAAEGGYGSVFLQDESRSKGAELHWISDNGILICDRGCSVVHPISEL